MLLHSAIAAGETMERMIADMGPLLEFKRDISGFYRTLANKRQHVRAENGGYDGMSQLQHSQNNVILTWPGVYDPSVQELKLHLKAHVVLMQKLLGDNHELVSAYQLCDKHLKTIMDAYEAEKAYQQQEVQHVHNDRAATVPQSLGHHADLNGMTMSMGPRPPARAGSPSIEEMGTPAKKAKIQPPLSAARMETRQERVHGRAFHWPPDPWRV